jgi:hypothetical protein
MRDGPSNPPRLSVARREADRLTDVLPRGGNRNGKRCGDLS